MTMGRQSEKNDLKNHELNQIAAWINANNLTINPSKTYALIISPFTNLNSPTLNLFYNHHRIDVVRTVKYLWYHFRQSTTF